MFRIIKFLKLRKMVFGKRYNTPVGVSQLLPAHSLLTAGILIPVLVFTLNTTGQQRLTYDIMRKNEPIGVVHTSIINNGASAIYEIETHVNVRVIYQISVDVNLQSKYESGVMREASLLKHINGSEKTNNHIRWSNGYYSITSKDHKTSSLQGNITCSIASLYFIEPRNISLAFSETFLTYVPVKKVGEGKYSITLPDGRVNTYHYQNGVCTEVEIQTTLSTVYLILINNNNKTM